MYINIYIYIYIYINIYIYWKYMFQATITCINDYDMGRLGKAYVVSVFMIKMEILKSKLIGLQKIRK